MAGALAPPGTPEVTADHRDLMLIGRLWSTGRDDGATAVTVRARLIEAAHNRQLRLNPAYAAVAAETGVGAGAAYDRLRRDLVVSDEWFRGYDATWLGAPEVPPDRPGRSGGAAPGGAARTDGPTIAVGTGSAARAFDAEALTAWLARVSAVDPAAPAAARDLLEWRAALRRDGVRHPVQRHHGHTRAGSARCGDPGGAAARVGLSAAVGARPRRV